MKAQIIYNLRDEYGFCSGMDLHEFFYAQGVGMSPSGRVDIPTKAAKQFMTAGVERQYFPGDSVVGDVWRDAALAAINAA